MSAAKGFIPNGQRPTLVAPEKPTVMLPPLAERERKPLLMDPRLHRAVVVLLLLCGLVMFGYFAAWLFVQYGGPR